MALPKVGDKALEFSLPDQEGKKHFLSDYKGKWILLYFYPKDNTPGCTKEACAIRDRFPQFQKLGITVLGVSVDSVERHEQFANQYRLPFLLLADEGKIVVKRYGVWGKKRMMGREYMGTKRTSFLINPKGRITKVYTNVKPEVHAEEVLRDLIEFMQKY